MVRYEHPAAWHMNESRDAFERLDTRLTILTTVPLNDTAPAMAAA